MKRYRAYFVLYVIVFAAAALVGCGGSDSSSSGSGDNSGSSGGGTNATGFPLAGLYNASENARDIFVTHISETGVATDYDFLGDSFDQGVNCYLMELTGTFTSLGDDRYFFEAQGFTSIVGSFEVTARIENSTLVFTRQDLSDADSDGDRDELITFGNPVITDQTLEDLQPICTDEDLFFF